MGLFVYCICMIVVFLGRKSIFVKFLNMCYIKVVLSEVFKFSVKVIGYKILIWK